MDFFKIFKKKPKDMTASPAPVPFETIKKEIPKTIFTPPSDPLDNFHRTFIYAKSFYNGCPIVYKYRRLPTSAVDRNVLREMVADEQFSVDVIPAPDNTVALMWSGKQVATLSDHASMCKDWISRQDPLICEFVEFNPNKEMVALYFYRDEQSKYSDRRFDIIKLTSFMGADKQETINCMETGEKLYIDEDDNGKYYLRDIDYNPIGNLPAKYAKLYDNGEISAVFFDHFDTEEKDNGDEKYIPFVKLYY